MAVLYAGLTVTCGPLSLTLEPPSNIPILLIFPIFGEVGNPENSLQYVQEMSRYLPAQKRLGYITWEPSFWARVDRSICTSYLLSTPFHRD